MDASAQRQRIRDEAAGWVVRLSEPCAPDLRAEFEDWRDASIDHEIAFEREMAAWERLDRAKALRAPDGRLDLVSSLATPSPVRPRKPTTSRKWLAVAASLLVATSLGLASLLPLTATRAYATAIGEQQLVRLDDGTLVTLNTDSRIEVRYSGGVRLVRLMRGEALFHVASDSRPFTLQTPALSLDARDAEFSVRLTGEGARVTVNHGATLAEATHAQGGQGAMMIGPDSQAVIDSGGARLERMSTAEVDRLQAWQRGTIELNGQSLREAAGEFNRYSARKIIISDDRTAALHVGGYFRTTDVDGFVRAITKTFPVRVTATTSDEIVLSGNP